MNPRINQLVKTLLQKESLEQCTLPELQEFAERHPYFGAAQLLLTKKMQKENAANYDEQLQKTFLFFHNPLWVEHLLNENGRAEIIPAENMEGVVTPEKIEVLPPLPAAIEETVVAVTPALQPELVETASQKTEEPELKLPEFKIEAIDPAKAELVFEPYHTVDYFASQGIAPKTEEKPTDKFGKQLKSFTEWLKTMRKLPVAEIAAVAGPAAEKKVEEMAEISIREREVITEAMAEVWEKQGNIVKAADIYSKLSLLEPSKSAYFAAKIEELQKTN